MAAFRFVVSCRWRLGSSALPPAGPRIQTVWGRRLGVSAHTGDDRWHLAHSAYPYRSALDAPFDPSTMLKIDRATMVLLGELADLRREDESAVVVAAVGRSTPRLRRSRRLMDRHGLSHEP